MTRANSLTETAKYELLSDTRRLHLLTLLSEYGSADLETLTRQIAARELDDDPAVIAEDVFQRISISLVHKHLPLLEEHNVVQFDSDRHTVTLMDVVDELELCSSGPTISLSSGSCRSSSVDRGPDESRC
ncbi:hypothetical protein D8Y22_18615 [Salinadaptatus halalkaliphilus]|uniref:DUF7344 domain-containing protein n=1 Tax=Salinadaptatus halalkaliphilus TaxID=2419781 RepID=A0A4S3TL47_9EURY|nr:hypothetical protein [Salinadaptatus halalkaliphilus]THE63318.1 hypothetical protein D8Y22_18615 [Salinadaptatus halalkaliphilus]